MTQEQKVLIAWRKYRRVEKYGLAFGRACYDWQQKLATKGGIGNKGKGIVPSLEQLNIPVSTAYFWIAKYEETIGIKQTKKFIVQPNEGLEHLDTWPATLDENQESHTHIITEQEQKIPPFEVVPPPIYKRMDGVLDAVIHVIGFEISCATKDVDPSLRDEFEDLLGERVIALGEQLRSRTAKRLLVQ